MIVPMKHLTLVGRKSDEEPILAALQDIGAVEVLPPRDIEGNAQNGGDGENLSNTSSDVKAKISAYASENEEALRQNEDNARRFDDAVRTLTPYTKKPSMLAPLAEITTAELLSEEAMKEAVGLCVEIETIVAKLAENKTKSAACLAQIKQLAPWEALDVQTDKLHSLKHVDMVVGFLPSTAYRELLGELDSVACTIQEISRDAQNVAMLVAFKRSDAQETRATLTKHGFVEYAFGAGIVGLVSDNIKRLKSEDTSFIQDNKRLHNRLAELSVNKQKLEIAADAVRALTERERAKSDVLVSQATFLLEGWVRTDEIEQIETAISAVTNAYFSQYDDPTEEEIPPSVVKNNKFVQPFETITNMYSRPNPINGIDATPFMMPFYLLFFGMMLSDSGYGLILFLGCLLFEKIKKPRPGMAGLVGVIKWCGLATVVLGVLFGTCFGMSWNTILLGKSDGPFPLIFDPMVDSMNMLFLTFGLGIVQMMFGVGVKIYMCVKQGDTAAAIFDNLSWMFIILGIVGYVIVPPVKQAFLVLAVVGALMLLLFAGRAKKGLGRITGGFGALYNITGYLSDTVSYARIFALGLATGAMGSVFNMLGVMVAGSGDNILMQILRFVAAGLVLAILHLFSLFLNTLGAFAHSARLQYVEFFGKFYETGGREFKPLGYHTGYVNIKK